MTSNLRIIKTCTIVRQKLRTTATRIIVTKKPKTADISHVQIAEISYLSADVNDKNLQTKICQVFSLVVKFRYRGYQRRIFSLLGRFELASFTVTVVPESLSSLILKHG